MTETPLYLLCVEPVYPGRLGWLVDWLARRRGYRAWFVCRSVEPAVFLPPSTGRGIEIIQYTPDGVAAESAVHWYRGVERAIRHGIAVWRAVELRRPRPVDLILGHSAGLGSTLFLRSLLPGVPIIQLSDYFLSPEKYDLADEVGPDTPPEYFHWRRANVAIDLLDLENAHCVWTTSDWQRYLLPAEYRPDVAVLPLGADPSWPMVFPADLAQRGPIVTFVASALDRLRGFDRFVRLAAELQTEFPNVIFVAVGERIVSRGLDVQHFGQDYASQVLAEHPLPDPSRFLMPGRLPPAVVRGLIAESRLHVYGSRRYPVSRSLFEAMLAGRVILAADHEPNREVLTANETALLAAPQEWPALARRVLLNPPEFAALGERARERASERYSFEVTMPRFSQFLNDTWAKSGGSFK